MKPHTSALARIRLAEAELATAEHEFMKSALPWRQRLHRHRNALNLASGFAAGLALTLLPSRGWAGVGVVAGGGGRFGGRRKGEPEGLDQKTGRKRGGLKTGSGIVTNPMSFAVDGRQYVAISSGWSIVPSKAIAGAKLLNAPGQKNVLSSTMLFVFALP